MCTYKSMRLLRIPHQASMAKHCLPLVDSKAALRTCWSCRARTRNKARKRAHRRLSPAPALKHPRCVVRCVLRRARSRRPGGSAPRTAYAVQSCRRPSASSTRCLHLTPVYTPAPTPSHQPSPQSLPSPIPLQSHRQGDQRSHFRCAQSVSVQQIRDIVKGIKGNQSPGPPSGSGGGSPLRRSSTSVGPAGAHHLERKDS